MTIRLNAIANQPQFSEEPLLCDAFDRQFVFGVATSSFQIEGNRSSVPRGESIWDRFCEQPGAIADGSNGLVAVDHINHLDSDLDLIARLGFRAYRFSISWPRVQPDGSGEWSEAGFQFYDRLLEGLRQRGIAAYLTLYHWDLPQALQEQGGWNNRDTVACFVKYAKEVARRYGHLVKSIATHNEPWVVATLGHETGVFAPGIKCRKTAYQVAHHLLLSHGLAVRALREICPNTQLGIVFNLSPIHAATDSEADREKARLDDGQTVRWYLDPVLKGIYPEDVWAWLGADVPQIEPADLSIISEPIDFIGVNYYTRGVAFNEQKSKPELDPDCCTDMGWEIYPQGLTELLLRLNRDYTLPPVVITENGAAFKDQLHSGVVNDQRRVNYFESHLEALHKAVEGGVNVIGYFVWSLLDNFEWASGFEKRFGIVYVDYDNLNRIPKASAHWWAEFLNNRAASLKVKD
jgi:beta-glucosidase